jgi:hypothetical protein
MTDERISKNIPQSKAKGNRNRGIPWKRCNEYVKSEKA